MCRGALCPPLARQMCKAMTGCGSQSGGGCLGPPVAHEQGNAAHTCAVVHCSVLCCVVQCYIVKRTALEGSSPTGFNMCSSVWQQYFLLAHRSCCTCEASVLLSGAAGDCCYTSVPPVTTGITKHRIDTVFDVENLRNISGPSTSQHAASQV